MSDAVAGNGPGGRFAWLAPMVLWPLAEPLISERLSSPSRAGRQPRNDDEAVFAAVVFVLSSGVPWRSSPKLFGISWQTVHRRFSTWHDAGLWEQLASAAGVGRMDPSARHWAGVLADAAGARSRASMRSAADAEPSTVPRLAPRITEHVPTGLPESLFSLGNYPSSAWNSPSRPDSREPHRKRAEG
ncbi:transposase [Nocardiopsis sp. NPDC101807]|uniref:transposase n=1 Tax=Nocardiopsis sp. NPDC101807 TaxID=3364339 RepID=UPI003809E4D7